LPGARQKRAEVFGKVMLKSEVNYCAELICPFLSADEQ
jgi:hypothetical protein